MGQVYDGIDDRVRAFIGAQPVFFVATAPERGGHVNLSPKGYADTFTVLDPRTVAYRDLTGSGIETIAHLRENARITLMFCAFAGQPKIVRLYGTGRAVVPGDADWDHLSGHFPPHPGQRAVIVVDVERVADSCGFAVPFMDCVGERDVLQRSHERRGPDGMQRYRAERNGTSIDGLPGLPGLAGLPVSQPG